MRRRRSRSRSRSPESSRSRSRRSPSEYRSMTRSRSRSPSPTRSRSRDRGPPLRSKYARSSSSRSLSPPRGGGRPPSRSTPVSTIDLTKIVSNDAAAPWLDSVGQPNAPSQMPSNLNDPPPSFGNPTPAQVPPMESKPIPSVGQSRMGFPPPSHSSRDFGNFQGDFPGYGSSFYPGENRNYPDGQPLNNFNALPGQNYAPQMDGGGWSYPGNANSQSGFDMEFRSAPLAAPPAEVPPPAGLPTLSGIPTVAGIPSVPVAQAGIKNAAVEQELVQQRKTLAVQREEYFKKRIAMTKDLKALREQAESITELGGSKSIVKENKKLQDEMLQKIKSIDNVIDMLTHIIGDREQIADLLKGFASALELPKKEPKPNRSEKRRKSKSRSRSRSPSRKKKSTNSRKKSATPDVKVNIEHYDPELHWCSLCNVFPRSATEYLTHLHSDVHKMGLRGKKSKDKLDEEFHPWRLHEPREPSPPSYKDAPCKRVPIRGVPFLVPATAWYCSMCRTWLGELELAERHLKGPKHASMYTEFVSQNPHWEVDWLRDRTRAYERNSEARAKVEEISKQLASKKDKPEKATEVNLEKLKEMLASVRKKAAEKGRDSDSRSNTSSGSSSSEESDKEDKKKSKKKKGKEGEKKKKKKTAEMKDGDKGVRSDKMRKSSDKREMSSRERRSEDRSDRGEQRPDRSENQHRNFRSDDRGYYRGRGRSFRGRYDRGGRTHDRDRRSDREDRASKEKHDRKSRDRDCDDGSKKNSKKSPERKRSPFQGEHDWDRVKPLVPPSQVRSGAKAPAVMIGKRPGLVGIARDKFGFHRKNVFERLDKDKPDDLYGPLEPPKNE